MGKIIKSGIEYAGGGGGGGDEWRDYIIAPGTEAGHSAYFGQDINDNSYALITEPTGLFFRSEQVDMHFPDKTYVDNAIGALDIPTIVQATGQSTTDVMSQKAATNMIFPSYDTLGTKEIVIAGGNVEWVGDSRYTAPVLSIGNGTVISAPVGTETNPTSAGAIAMMGGKAEGHHSIAIYGEAKGGLAVGDMSKAGQLSVAIGHQTKASNNQQLDGSVALGFGASTTKLSSVALGASAVVTRIGEVNVGTNAPLVFPGYNNTKYRVIGGVHDGVDDHDAVTVGQLNTAIAGVEVPTVVQGIGNSETDVMSQNAVSKMIFPYNGSSSVGAIIIGDTTPESTLVNNGTVLIGSNYQGETSAMDSVIIGRTNNAGIESVCIGHSSGGDNASSRFVTVGSEATTTGPYGISVGWRAVSEGSGVAVGSNVISKGGIAIGSGAKVNDSSISISIGRNTVAQNGGIAIGALRFGSPASVTGQSGIAIGGGASVTHSNSVALGGGAASTREKEVNVGYDGTGRRVIGGVADGTELSDAATVAQGNKLMTAAPTTTSEGVLGQLWTDTTAMHTYQCTAIDTTDPDNPVYTWTQRW